VLTNQYVLEWSTDTADGGLHGIAVEAHWDSCSVTETATYACGGACMAARTLPLGYVVESAAPVSITVRPDAGVQTYALEDVPPAGMVVANINEGGVLDNGKVKWGPFFDNQDRDLSYEITPPAGTEGALGWTGVFSHDGVGEAICGDRLLPEGSVHPADLGASGDNWRIEINELTAYTSAWKTGAGWPRPPTPILLPYAVNAGYLWKNGEDYHFDPLRDPPWDVGDVTMSVEFAQGVLDSALTSGYAYSSIAPSTYTPGEPMDVTLAISPPIATQAYAVEETPPEGWTVSDISDDGTFSAQSNQIRWGIFFDDVPRDLTYRITPPAAAVGVQSLFGNAAFDDQIVPITGQRTVPPAACSGETLHLHDMTITSGDELVCSAAVSVTLGPNVDIEPAALIDLQAGDVVTFSPPVRVQQGGLLHVGVPDP
jgi:hypothetical protein